MLQFRNSISKHGKVLLNHIYLIGCYSSDYDTVMYSRGGWHAGPSCSKHP